MGGRNSRFFHELSPLARAIGRVCTTPQSLVKPVLSLQEAADIGQREHDAARARMAKKLARRAARAGHKVDA